MNDIPISCPSCRTDLGVLHELSKTVTCPNCMAEYHQHEGIWHFMSPEKIKYFSKFLDDYSFIRKEEKRGSNDPQFYHHLPFVSPSTPYAWQWQIRAKSYQLLVRKILQKIGTGLQILDLGAGNGWLSQRLYTNGHFPCAIDINIDPYDGLSAARHFSPEWPRIRSEFDSLPIANSSMDVIIFNASIHYSKDYICTFSEALRILKPSGQIIVMDSPIYRHDHSGKNMAVNRKERYMQKYNRALDGIISHEFLTWKGLDELADKLNMTYRPYKAWYGINWIFRNVKAAILQQHEHPSFALLVFESKTGKIS